MLRFVDTLALSDLARLEALARALSTIGADTPAGVALRASCDATTKAACSLASGEDQEDEQESTIGVAVDGPGGL